MKIFILGFCLTLLVLESAAAPTEEKRDSLHLQSTDGNVHKAVFTQADDLTQFPAESAVVKSRKVIKTAENGQDYEYEYLYYYDDDAGNETAADLKDDLLLDLGNEKKSSNQPNEVPQFISETADHVDNKDVHSVTDAVETAFSETSQMDVHMGTHEDVPKNPEVLLFTPSLTTTVAPMTTAAPKVSVKTVEEPEIQKTRSGSSSSRIRSKPTSASSTKTTPAQKAGETDTTTRKTTSRGKNRFTLNNDQNPPVEKSSDNQSSKSSQSRRRVSSSSTKQAESNPVPPENSRRTSDSKANPRVNSPKQDKTTERRTTESAPVITTTTSTEVNIPKEPSKLKSFTWDFEAELNVPDNDELQTDTRSSSVDQPQADNETKKIVEEVLVGRDEAAAARIEADAVPTLEVAQPIAAVEVKQNDEVSVEQVKVVTEAAIANEEARTTESALPTTEVRNIPSELKSIVEEGAISSNPIVPEATVSATSEVAVIEVKEEAKQIPADKQEDARVVNKENDTKISPAGGRRNITNKQRGESTRTSNSRKSTKTTPAAAETTTTTTTTTTVATTRSLFGNNRGRLGASRFGQPKQATKTEEPAANAVTEASTTAATPVVKTPTRRPFPVSPLRRTSTTTEAVKEEVSTASTVQVSTTTAATAATAANAASRTRGRQRFNVHRGFQVTDSSAPTNPEPAEKAAEATPNETVQPQAETKETFSAVKPIKSIAPAQRPRPNILLRSRTTTTATVDVADAAENPADKEAEQEVKDVKEVFTTKRPLKSITFEVSTETPVTSTVQSRLNLLRSRPPLVVSERPKISRNEVNVVDRKNRFSSFLKKPANQTEEVKTEQETPNEAEKPAEVKSSETAAPAAEVVQEVKPVEEPREDNVSPISNRLRGNRRPGAILASRRIQVSN